MTRPQPGLIRRFENYGITSSDAPLDDLLLAIATNIEDALLSAGAKPGTDYTYLDLFKLANPYALERWSAEDSKVSIQL